MTEFAPDTMIEIGVGHVAHALVDREWACGGPVALMVPADLRECFWHEWRLCIDRQFMAWPPAACPACVQALQKTEEGE